MLMLPTILLGGVAIALPRVRLGWRIPLALSPLLIGSTTGIDPGDGPTGVIVTLGISVILMGLILAGWRTRWVLGTVAVASTLTVIGSTLTADLPAWRAMIGAATYPMVAAVPTMAVASILRPRQQPMMPLLPEQVEVDAT